MVKVNRTLHAPGDPVAEIYGNPLSKPVRVIAPDPDRLTSKGDWVRITAPFEVKLSEFGVKIPKKPAQRVDDTWRVKVQVFASTVAS